MNIFDIIILAILGISLISGMYKGFLGSSLAIVGFIAAWIGAMHFYPQLSAAVQTNTNVMNMLRYYLDASSFFPNAAAAEKLVGTISQTELAQTVAALHLPDLLTQAFQSNVLAQAFSSLNLNTLADYLAQTLCGAAINVLSFLAMFIVSYVVVLLVVNLLNHVFRFPVLRHLDGLLGGLFGLARGAVIAALIFSIVPLVLSMVPLEIADDLLNGSALYGLFSQHNILADLMKSVF